MRRLHRVLLAFGLAACTGAGVRGDQTPSMPDSSVHAVLRIASDRTSFLSGEDVRLELSVAATEPGRSLIVEAPTDAQILMTPERGVFRWAKLMPRIYSDVIAMASLSKQPQTSQFSLNDVLRFDAPGEYTVRLRVPVDTKLPGLKSVGSIVTTNAVTFRIDLASDAQEKSLVDHAIERVRASRFASPDDQRASANALAFLTGDLAAREKLTLYEQISEPEFRRTQSLLRNGFFISRHPRIILDELERELRDLNRSLAPQLIQDAAEMKWWADAKESPRRGAGGLVPPMPPSVGRHLDADPFDRYLNANIDLVLASLSQRAGRSQVDAALAVLDYLDDSERTGVMDIIVRRFDELPVDRRVDLAGRRWMPADSRLTPSLLRLLGDPSAPDLNDVLRLLIRIDPVAAVKPAMALIASPSRDVPPEVLEPLPPASLRPGVPALLQAIRDITAGSTPQRRAALRNKVAVLQSIGNGDAVDDVAAIVRERAYRMDIETRSRLNAYLARWGTAGQSQILRLRPGEYSGASVGLSRAEVVYLDSKDCTIPQTWDEPRPHNVIASRFREAQITDDIALCSRNGWSSLMLFPNQSTENVIEVGARPDEEFMTPVSARGARGFARRLVVATSNHLSQTPWFVAAAGGARIDLDGVIDASPGQPESIWYWTSHALQRLTKK